MIMPDTVSLYLHIPFCRHRCAYCDFNTYTGLGDLQHAYAGALAGEVAQVGRAGEKLAGRRLSAHTVFFGGGTPSLMAPPDLGLILQSVRESFALADAAEITMEANPGTVGAAYLEAVRALGVNRLSFGMQSAVSTELALLERSHDYAAVREAVALSRAAGFDNVSLDLIYGLPSQALDSWQESLDGALALAPDHLSLYCLTIEPGTPMQRWLLEGRIAMPDPDLATEQYELACARLAVTGWEHYEISNWSRPGHACRHNLTYWRNEPYLGLGAGAHGCAGDTRYENVRQPRTYLRRMGDSPGARYPLSAAVAASHPVGDQEAMGDTMITQLRLLVDGLDLEAFARRFGRNVREVYGEVIDQLEGWGLLQESEGRLVLTERGWFLSNQVFYRFL
jgi:oxygen-independent coproporphyrinogen-3 oxidase